MEDLKKKQRQCATENIGLAGAEAEIVQRYGSAVKEHLVAYSGVDRETGEALKRGLKSISESKVNPEYAKQNIEQQAGFSAEIGTIAKENAESIISGKLIRSTRTDDMTRQTTAKGQSIGGTNDQLFDLAEVASDGSYIEGSARQLKYVGSDPKACCTKLLGKKFDKYRDADVPIEVPKDFFDKVGIELDSRAESLERQIERAKQKGNTELAQKHEQELARVQKTKANLRAGKLDKKEAIFARCHPELYTAKNIVNISHRAGLEAAKSGAIIGGGMSFIRNSIAVLKGDEDPETAILAVAGDTTSAAGVSYATGFVGSAIKGGMQNAESTYLQAVSGTPIPALIATSVLEAGKTLYRFADGQIDGLQCLNELGEKGSGVVASTAGMVIGQALIPIPIVGGMVGSMLGYALSSMYYDTLTSALNEAKFAHEERLRIEAECEEAIAAIREYRFEMEVAIRNYFSDHINAFNQAFTQIQTAFHTGDIDTFIAGTNIITEFLGEEALFHTEGELEALMASEDTIKI